jgi:hypothetical protein
MAEPDWLAGQATDLAKLRAIMAAVHRCFMECPTGDGEPTGPHITTGMAEIFIGQMLDRAVKETSRAAAVMAAAGDFGDAVRAATEEVMTARLAEIDAAVRADERKRIHALAKERLDLLAPDDFGPASQTLADILIITHPEATS